MFERALQRLAQVPSVSTVVHNKSSSVYISNTFLKADILKIAEYIPHSGVDRTWKFTVLAKAIVKTLILEVHLTEWCG